MRVSRAAQRSIYLADRAHDADLFEDAPTPRVVNVKSGARYDIYIGRENATYGLPASKWANPFKLERESDRAAVLEQYRAWLMTQPRLLAALPELRGKVLGCWCAPRACHGDVLLELANAPAPKSARTPQRQCPVCGLLRPLVGRVCVECRHEARSLLTSQRSASEGTRRALDTAVAAFTAAMERATDEHRAAWDRMQAARGTMNKAEFARKHQAALAHKSGFGDIARAQAEIDRLTTVLRDVEGKIATLEDVVLIQEANALDWAEGVQE